jgi:hypothetical protein
VSHPTKKFYPLPKLNATDLALLKTMDEALGYTPGEDRTVLAAYTNDYLKARHALELRLRSLCQLSNIGVRAACGLRKQREEMTRVRKGVPAE